MHSPVVACCSRHSMRPTNVITFSDLLLPGADSKTAAQQNGDLKRPSKQHAPYDGDDVRGARFIASMPST
jgi:hypothetical protein